MTVAELMESLKHYPPDALVVVPEFDHKYRQARDWPVIVVADKSRRRLSEDNEAESDADLRARGERRFAGMVLR